MNTLIAAILLTTTSLSFACADLKHKPAYLTQDGISCGTVVNKIIHPKAIIKGKTYALALNLSDDSGGCPADDQSCYPPYLNIVRQENIICKAYGMGPSAHSNSYSPIFHWGHETPDYMVEMKRVNPTTYAPRVFRMNHERSEYTEIREVWCHKVYRK